MSPSWSLVKSHVSARNSASLSNLRWPLAASSKICSNSVFICVQLRFDEANTKVLLKFDLDTKKKATHNVSRFGIVAKACLLNLCAEGIIELTVLLDNELTVHNALNGFSLRIGIVNSCRVRSRKSYLEITQIVVCDDRES